MADRARAAVHPRYRPSFTDRRRSRGGRGVDSLARHGDQPRGLSCVADGGGGDGRRGFEGYADTVFLGDRTRKIVKVGDWVSVLDREGIVTHIGMEHVTLFSRAHDVVSLPNDLVIQSGVTNYTRPTTTHFCNVFVDAAYRTPPEDVCATLLEVAAAVSGVLPEPKATALVVAFNESAIQYRIKFPIGDFAQRDMIESTMRTYIWHAFSRKGIEIPFPQRVVHRIADTEPDAKAATIERISAYLPTVDFLATLDMKQIEVLAGGARWERYLPGERVVRQGDPGAVLYIIVAGKADVRLEQGD